MTAALYASISKEVDKLVHRLGNTTEPDVAAYMIMRAAMLNVRARRSPDDTSALAYRLADEFATQGGRGG
jgi:hypothetical protein